MTASRRARELAAAYAHCAAIAAEHGQSYHLATRLLTADRRPAVHALYAAARTADDLVDLPGADPGGDLADWSAGSARRAPPGVVGGPRPAGAGATPSSGTTSRSCTSWTSWPP